MKFNTHISRHKGKSFYKSSETGRCDKNILIEDDNLIVNKLTNYDDLFYVEVIKELTNLRFEIPEDAPFTIVEKFYTIKVKEQTNNQSYGV